MKPTERELDLIRGLESCKLHELALFVGGGGGLLGTHLLGCRVVGAVELDADARQSLIARQRDSGIGEFPVWSDVRTFNGSAFRDLVDVVTAGFPCQPFSLAGKQKASKDDRNMWPDTARIIREVRPAVVLLENVPGLLSKKHRYFGTVLGDLAEIGFDAECGCLSASAIGARHRRERLWILAYSVRDGAREVLAQLAGQGQQASIGAGRRVRAQPGDSGDDVADAEHNGIRRRSTRSSNQESTGALSQIKRRGGVSANSDGQRFSRGTERDCKPFEFRLDASCGHDSGGLRDDVPDSDSDSVRQQFRRPESGARETVPSGDGEAINGATAQPGLGGMADGLADRLDPPWCIEPGDVPRVVQAIPGSIPKLRWRVARLKLIGNGQVPLCAAVAWRLLACRALEVLDG